MKKRLKGVLIYFGAAVIFLIFDYLTQGMLEKYLGHTLYMMLYIVLAYSIAWYVSRK